LGIKVCTQTVVNVLKRHGIRPGPGKGSGMTWNEFIATHKDCKHPVWTVWKFGHVSVIIVPT